MTKTGGYKADRGDYPMGVSYEKEKSKFRAAMSFMGEQSKLGTFDTAEATFARYKKYKEDFIQDLAVQYRNVMPDKVYEAVMGWRIEIDD